jgi:iron complex outermembrane receptor protein
MGFEKKFVKTKLGLGIAVATAVLGSSVAQGQDESSITHLEDRLESIVITAPFQASEAQTALPIGILSGEALREKAANSLGATLQNEIGVANASFGTGVGQPIIRGQTGNRVSILQNGLGLTDASNVSPDHVNGTEALLADRIEVIRGPSTLLYGSGAVGGVVNVIDNRIPSTLTDHPHFQVEQTHNGVNDENRTVIRLDASVGNFGFHLDGFTRENNNVEIKGFAVDEAAVEAIEELAEGLTGGHDEDHGDEHGEEEFENTNGFIGNSDGEGKGFTVGGSYVGDSGFFGFSVAEIENEYGLPPGAHSHAHGEEEHGEEDHGDEDHGEEHEEEEVEFVRIGMEQTRYDFKGQYSFTNSFIESVKASVGYTDYEHRELEIFEDGAVEVGTLFSNEGTEARFEFKRAATGNWEGVWGLQLSNTQFSALGEEAFIPRTDVANLGLFGVERYTNDAITAELGFRFEDNDVDPDGACNNSESALSVSGSVLYDIDERSNILVAAARSERAPSLEELYSNIAVADCSRVVDNADLVVHAATSLYEVGNTQLDKETSNNIEFGYRRHSGPVTGEFSAYYNQIDDYIFLGLSGERIDEQFIANYQAGDATFSGLEAEVSLAIYESNGVSGELSFFGDIVNAEFDAGGNVPRIPPAKIGAELRYFADNWSAHIHATRFGAQDDAGLLELQTPGYTLVSVYADYHVPVGGDSEFKLFARGDNLLNEEVRNHASLLRNFAPEPGRGVTLGLRFEY